MSLVESIERFEKIHREYLKKDGSLNRKGYNLLHAYEKNWTEDPKWSDYFCFHLGPRLASYWYDKNEDKEYKEAWKKLHS